MRYSLANERSLRLAPNRSTTSMKPVLGRGKDGAPGQNGSNVLPTDTAIADALENVASESRAVVDGLLDALTAADVGAATAAQGATADTAVQPAALAAGLAANATADRARANHTGTQAQSTVVNLTTDLAAKLATADAPELIRDTMAAALVAGTNITITPDDSGNTITIAASGGSGGGPLASVVRTDANSASYSISSAATPADVDAANLAVTFTAPASGRVAVTLSATASTGAATNHMFWSLREGTTNIAGTEVMVIGNHGSANAISRETVTVFVSGLVPDSVHTYKWAWRTSSNQVNLFYGAASAEFSSGSTVNRGPATMEVRSA